LPSSEAPPSPRADQTGPLPSLPFVDTTHSATVDEPVAHPPAADIEITVTAPSQIDAADDTTNGDNDNANEDVDDNNNDNVNIEQDIDADITPAEDNNNTDNNDNDNDDDDDDDDDLPVLNEADLDKLDERALLEKGVTSKLEQVLGAIDFSDDESS
jgi:hypothetical protein